MAEAEEVGEWMARRHKRKGGHRSKKIPILVTAGVASGVLSAFAFAGGLNEKLPAAIVSRYTGYYAPSNKWDFSYCKDTWMAIAAGAVGSMLASKLGVNRRLSFIPFVKL